MCIGIEGFFEELPHNSEITEEIKNHTSYIRKTLKQIKDPELLICPFGFSLEELIQNFNLNLNLQIEQRFGIHNFNDRNGKIKYYPPYHLNRKSLSKAEHLQHTNQIFEIGLIEKSPIHGINQTANQVHTNLCNINACSITLEDYLTLYAHYRYFGQPNLSFQTPTLITNTIISPTQESLICFENEYQELIINPVYIFHNINYGFQTFIKKAI